VAKTYSAKQKKLRVKIIGAEEIVKRLKNMESAAADVLMSATKAGGKIALDDAKQNCPVNKGALKNSLKLEEGKATQTKADVKVNYYKSIKYGAFVELGTKKNSANPFLRNAVDKNLDKINEKITESIADAVGKKM
jgi:HK97 gp10 family phage protein